MKNTIKKLVKKYLFEQFIDGQNMGPNTQSICNKMTINSYEEALSLVQDSLNEMSEHERRDIMQKILAPLENLKHEQNKIKNEIERYHMSGDSIPDEANTYWHQIQSTICELGKHFQ
jgi:hypothetical protein